MSAESYDDAPPPYDEPTDYNPVAELAVISVALLSLAARKEIRRTITGADLYNPAAETLWDILSDLDTAGTQVDPTTVMSVVLAMPKAQRRQQDAARTLLVSAMNTRPR